MPQHDTSRRTPTQPRDRVASQRHGEERRDRFDPVSVALAAWTDTDPTPPASARPARSSHPAPRQRQPWLPADGGGRVDPRDVARAAMAAQAAAAATETEEHPISDQDARPGLISRLAGRVRDARSAGDAQPDAGAARPSDTGSTSTGSTGATGTTGTTGSQSSGEQTATGDPHSSVEPARATHASNTTDPTGAADEVDQEGSWVHHDGSDGHEGWLYHYADGTVVDADGTVHEPSHLDTGDSPAPDAPHPDQDEAPSTPEGDARTPVPADPADPTGSTDDAPAGAPGKDAPSDASEEKAPDHPVTGAADDRDAQRGREADTDSAATQSPVEARGDTSAETDEQADAAQAAQATHGAQEAPEAQAAQAAQAHDRVDSSQNQPARAAHEDEPDHHSAAAAGAAGTAVAAGVATAHQASTGEEESATRDDHDAGTPDATHETDGDRDHGDADDETRDAAAAGSAAEARREGEDEDRDGATDDGDDNRVEAADDGEDDRDEAADDAEKSEDARDSGESDHPGGSTTVAAAKDGSKPADDEKHPEPASRTSVPAFVEYSPSEAPRYALGAVAALAAVGAVLIGFSAVANSSGSDLVLVVVLALLAAAALWALERWSPTVVTVDDGTLEVTRGSTVDQIDLRDPAVDVDLGTDVRSPSWSATFAEPEGSHVTLRRTQVKVGQFVEIVQHHRANLRTPDDRADDRA